MRLQRRVFVVAGNNTTFLGKHHPDFIWKKHPDFGTRENPTLEEHLGDAVNGLFAATGIDPDVVDKGYVGNFVAGCFVNQAHIGSLLARVTPGLAYKPLTRTEGACASGGLAVLGAVDALQAGANVTLACGVEVQTSVSARDGADYLARAAHYASERSIDEFTFPALFARRAKAYLGQTECTNEDLGKVVVKAYANANKNPKAHMRAYQMTLEQACEAGPANHYFLTNEDLRPYMKISDCSQVSDGASAVLLATEEGLAALGVSPDDCVELLGYGHAVGPLGQASDFHTLSVTRRAADAMYAEAGITAADVQVAEVHDCFSITEVLMYEALGFAEPGRGWTLAREGQTGLDGRIPVNTGGGLVAFGHPVGATGVKQVVEIARQMKGECGDYQLATPPKVGVTANVGGDDRTAVTMAFRKG
jgi:acetyl-CoA acyltransferase